MGCCASAEAGPTRKEDSHIKKNFKRPKWKSDEPMSRAQLTAKREEFWHTQPAYGGNKVVWDTLKGALECDHETTKLMLEAAEIIVTKDDMSEIFDTRGYKYELPQYVLSEPSNLSAEAAGGVELATQ